MSEPRPIIWLVKIDSLGRALLGKRATAKFYHTQINDDGVIVMKPVVRDAE